MEGAGAGGGSQEMKAGVTNDVLPLESIIVQITATEPRGR